MNIYKKYLSAHLLGIAVLLGGITPAIGQVNLGSASEFTVRMGGNR